MKKLLFTLYFLFFTFYLFSQANVLYNDGYNDIASSIVKYNNNSYYISGSYGTAGDRIKKIDENGNLLQEIILFNGSQQQRASFKSLEIINNKLYFLTKETEYGDTIKYFFSFTCFSLDFDTIWTKKYFVDTTSIFSNSFCLTNDSGFAIAGNIDKGNSNWDAFILKIDSLGNEQWYKEYYKFGSDAITNILQTNDNGFIVSGYSGGTDNHTDWYIVRTDSLGNQIWDWVLHNPLNLSDGAIADLIQTQDGNFVAIGGLTYACDYYCLQDARLLKFDINKNILLDTLYSEPFFDSQLQTSGLNRDNSFVKIKQKNNGNFIVLGYNMPYPHANILNSKLYEMDNNFNIIDEKIYKSTSLFFIQETLKDFLIEDDGSLSMIGDVNSYNQFTPSQQVWFVKTDPNYCDNFGACDTTLKFEFLGLPDTLAVNDTAYISFKITGGTIANRFNTTIEFNILNSTKYRLIYDSLLKDSIYTFKISKDILNNSGLLTSYPIDVGDSIFAFYHITATDSSRPAIFNTIGIKTIFSQPEVGIQEINKQKTNLLVYPNPAKNNVQITMNNLQLSKNTSVFVYDVFGHLVKQLKIKNYELKIQVADLEKGIYFVRVGSAVGKFVKE